MNTSWFAFLVPPKMSSYEHEQRPRLLHYMLMAVFLGALVSSISNYLNGWIPETVILSLLTLVCLGGFYLNYTRRYILAAWTFCTSFYIVISILLYHGAGLYDTTILAFPIFMICATFLFGTRGLFMATMASILAVLTIYLLQITGLFESIYHASFLRVAIVSLLFAALAVVIWIVRTTWEMNLTLLNESHDLTLQQSLEIRQRLKESNALAKIERALSETERIGTGEVLQLIVDSARELMPHAEKSVIHLLDEENQILVARAISGFNEHEKEFRGLKMRLGEGVAGQVVHEGITINVGDIKTNPQFLLNASVPTFQSLTVAPVQSGGRYIGTISVQSAAKNAFSSKDADLLNALAVQSAIAIENTRLFETTQQRLKEVNILYQISRSLAESLDADELIREMIGLLQQSFGYYHVQLYFIDPETRNLVIRHGSGYIGSELVKKGYHVPAGEGIVGHVAETAESFMTNNVEEVVFFKRNPLLSQTKSEIAIPIKLDNQIIGVLDIQQTPDRKRFTSSDLSLMTAIADQLAVVLQKANLYSTLQASLEQEKKVRSQLLQSERLAIVGRLLASVSHELNNPLQAIQYGLFLLRDETNLSNQARQDVDVLIAETERMTALIERLRSAYRPVRVQDFQSIPLNSLIEDVHALMTIYMRHNEIAFEFIPDAELPNVSGLPDQIRQVLLNLFLNAVEVMQPGGRLTVQTCFLPQEKEALLVVKDTGPGIDPEVLPQIFDAFISNKPTGTGLGLTITHDIIQQHKGRIQAENDPEAGAIFKVWLPVEERN